MKITDKYVFFWKEDPFCNFTKCKINYAGKVFSSSEQLFMWFKADFFGDNVIAKKILNTNEPEEARKLGRIVKNYDDRAWENVRVELMFQAVLSKFKQNEDLKEQLCDHKYDGKQFVEAAYYDRIWGIGYNENDTLITPEYKWGRNELGKILNEVREWFMLKSAGVYKDIVEA